MDALREKLRDFYQKQFESALSIRKTATNYLLIEKHNGKKRMLAKFSAENLGNNDAHLLAHSSCSKLIEARTNAEMDKLSPSS